MSRISKKDRQLVQRGEVVAGGDRESNGRAELRRYDESQSNSIT